MFNYENIISNELTLHNSNVLSNSESISELLTYYIHLNQGWEFIEGTFTDIKGLKVQNSNNILIKSLGHSKDDINYINYIFNNLDQLIDLDFQEIDTFNGSTIDIYSIDESSSFEKNALGQAITRTSNYGSWWEILWKDTDGKNNTNSSDKNTIIHEIGHALGLSHPNDDPDHDKWDTFDTVMSYNDHGKGWNSWFSENDINALQSIWGREDDTGDINFFVESNKYKISRTLEKDIIIETELGSENISHINNIIFKDRVMNIENDIYSIFEKIDDVNHITGKIFRLYGVFLNRFPDIDGYEFWLNKYQNGKMNLTEIRNSFINSTEYQQRFDQEINNYDFLESIYKEVLKRKYDDSGFDYWLAKLNSEEESKDGVIVHFYNSTESIHNYENELGLSSPILEQISLIQQNQITNLSL